MLWASSSSKESPKGGKKGWALGATLQILEHGLFLWVELEHLQPWRFTTTLAQLYLTTLHELAPHTDLYYTNTSLKLRKNWLRTQSHRPPQSQCSYEFAKNAPSLPAKLGFHYELTTKLSWVGRGFKESKHFPSTSIHLYASALLATIFFFQKKVLLSPRLESNSWSSYLSLPCAGIQVCA